MNDLYEEYDEVIQAPTNIFENEDGYFITLEVPGFSKLDVDASFDDDFLVIQGTKEIGDEVDYHMQDFKIKDFKNKYKIKRNTKIVSIKMEDGICTVHLIREEAEKSYIEVQ